MARYAVLNNNRNRVINIVGANAELAQSQGWVACPDNVGIDYSYNEQTNTFSIPSPNANKARREIKQTVRQLLRQTDWTQVPDNLNAAKQLAWKTFRQSLRDVITQAETDPFNVVWPTPPGDLDEDGL